jgi:hypothetical protein
MRMARICYSVAALGLLNVLAGCSDPVPPASQGAVAITLTSPDPVVGGPNTWTCRVPHTATAPIAVAGADRVSATNKGAIAVDRENGARVTCNVVPAGGGFTVTASIHAELSNAQGPQTADVSITGLTIGENQSDVPGMLAVTDSTTSTTNSSSSSEPCKFSVAGGSMGVGPGKVWGAITCPGLVESGMAGDFKCKAVGNFIFENCGQ